MLYYILPPFIIILSVGALIMFLFRKMENIPAEEVIELKPEKPAMERLKALQSALSQFGLRVLERMMHRLKLLSLKFHNGSNELFHSIREKREKRIKLDEEKKQQRQQQQEQAAQAIQLASKDILTATEEDRPRVKEPVLPTSQLDLKNTRMGAAMMRRAKPKANEKLEEALIKRIAVNPRDIEAYERLGDYYLERENHTDSLECFKQVLKLSPAHYKAKTRIRKLENLLK
jgi:tetratricopeptide (TPR) repeat protein